MHRALTTTRCRTQWARVQCLTEVVRTIPDSQHRTIDQINGRRINHVATVEHNTDQVTVKLTDLHAITVADKITLVDAAGNAITADVVLITSDHEQLSSQCNNLTHISSRSKTFSKLTQRRTQLPTILHNRTGSLFRQ